MKSLLGAIKDFKNAGKFTLDAIKERAIMSTYFRSKSFPIEYYSGTPIVEDGYNPIVIWVLRKVGTSKAIARTTEELGDQFDPCSPYEAISTIK